MHWVEIHKAQPFMSYPRFSRPSNDLKLLHWQIRQDKPNKLDISLNHIKEHQDYQREAIFEEAPASVQLNIEIEERAKKFSNNTKVA